MTLSLRQPHERHTRPVHVAALRLGLDLALFTSVLVAWPFLRLARIVLGRGRAR